MLARLKTEAARSGMAGGDKVWPLALTRAAREELGLDLEVAGLPPGCFAVEQIRPTGEALVLPLTADGGATGAVIIAGGLLQAIVEWQLSGRITATEGVRSPTRTDAMLIKPWIDHALRLMVEMLAQDDDHAALSGYRIGPGQGNLGAFSGDYRRIGGAVRIAGGVASGECLLILPPQTSSSSPSERDRRFTEDLRLQVLGTQAMMQAVLCRMTVPLGTVLSLREGGVLSLGGATVQEMAMEGADGAVLARGRLGQHRGMRAVRLVQEAADRPQGQVVALRDAS